MLHYSAVKSNTFLSTHSTHTHLPTTCPPPYCHRRACHPLTCHQTCHPLTSHQACHLLTCHPPCPPHPRQTCHWTSQFVELGQRNANLHQLEHDTEVWGTRLVVCLSCALTACGGSLCRLRLQPKLGHEWSQLARLEGSPEQVQRLRTERAHEWVLCAEALHANIFQSRPPV